MKRLTTLIALFCMVIVPWSMSLFGQGEEEDEIIELESFDVLEDDERRGYQSNLIIGANRMTVSIDEMATTAFVINSEFIEDLNPRYLTDVTRYVAGVENSKFYDVMDSIVIRSNETGTNLMDGFPYPGGAIQYVPVSLIEQVEVIKGPQGTLYGQISAGGFFNRVMKSRSSSEEEKSPSILAVGAILVGCSTSQDRFQATIMSPTALFTLRGLGAPVRTTSRPGGRTLPLREV